MSEVLMELVCCCVIRSYERVNGWGDYRNASNLRSTNRASSHLQLDLLRVRILSDWLEGKFRI